MSDFAAAADGNPITESGSSALQLGLAALKRKDYSAAIDHLQTVDSSTTDAAQRLKAQMGLIKAYGSTGKLDRAKALCQPLCHHPQPQIQTWAKQTLTQLEQRLEQRSHQPQVQATDAAATSNLDKTGFIPLASAPNLPKSSLKHLQIPIEVKTASVPAAAPASHLPPSEAADAIEELVVGEPEEEMIAALLATAEPSPSVAPSAAKRVTAARATPPQETHKTQELPPETTWQWRQAGRSHSGIRLASQPIWPLWVLQILTVLLLLWVIQTQITIAQTVINWLIFFFAWIPFVRSLYVWVNPTWIAVLAIGGMFGASPWLLDRLLQQCHRLKPLSLPELATHSPESVRLLQRQPQKHTPKLSILPASAPFAFTYGYLPQHTRIVVSQGLLQQLSDDEIATVYAAELGQIDIWNTGVLSGLVLVAQLPYWIYWTVSGWGDRQSDRVLQSVAVLVSSIGYGAYWCCTWAGRWLSHGRQYYGDRFATERTRNPNGRIRALLKITIGLAEAVQRQGYTPSVLESFALLMPVDHRAALSVGSVYPRSPTVNLLSWDRSNPYRRWFALYSSHPLLGDRLDWLARYAKRWQLEPELDQSLHSTSPATVQTFLRQAAPLAGGLIGLAIAILLSAVGWVSYRANWISLDWLWLERGSLWQGWMWLGVGVGLLLSINPNFPTINRSTWVADPALATLLSDASALPIDSVPVRMQGTLLGRRGFQNRLHQDLLLQTATGLIRLQYTSRAGFLGNLVSQAPRPSDLLTLNDSIVVTGWFRRGAHPWITVDTIQTRRGATLHSGQPVLLTIVAIGTALWGIYIILNGGW
jgi:Zn-dependent protease with chaperone function